jgi:curved DNA-binding protein
MQYKDYYSILGLARTSSAEDVKRAYRKLARKYHPDVSKERNAEDKFKELQEAYEVLKDPEKRAAYDQLGRDWRSGQQFRRPPNWEQRFSAGGEPGFSDVNGFSEFFSSLFGGARRRVTVHELGRPRVVDVQIPAGVADGQALRIGGGAGRQSLVFRVRIRTHALYALQGKDVLVELPLAPWEAALGTKVAVPTLGGTVELTIPAGAQSAQKLRLRGRGLPGSPAGDQIVSIKLVTPAADSAAARAAYERMKRELNFDARANWPQL